MYDKMFPFQSMTKSSEIDVVINNGDDDDDESGNRLVFSHEYAFHRKFKINLDHRPHMEAFKYTSSELPTKK